MSDAPSRASLPAPRPLVAVVLLVLLSVPVLFVGLGRYSPVNADEAFYHDVAWTMLETGNWWRVRTGPGEHVYDTFANAPLQYWARGLVISLVGPGLAGMRILSALAGLLTVLSTYGFVLHAAGRAAALLAGLLVLLNFQLVYLHAARTGELETGVALALVLLAWLFVRAIEDGRRGFVVHHLVLVALFLWKAPVVAIPVLAELVCFAVHAPARARLRAWLASGLAVAPLALVWHGYQAWRLRDALPDVLAAIGAQAGGGAGAMGAAHATAAARAAFYAERLAFGAWPQVVLLPAALWLLSPRLVGAAARREPAVRVIVIFAASVLGFYVAISKTGPWYVVHAAPFLAALVAIGLADASVRPRLPAGALLLASLGVGSLLVVAPPVLGYDPFSESALRIAMPLGPGLLGSLAQRAPLALTAFVGGALALAATFWLRHGHSHRPLVVALAAVIVALSALRVAAPLARLDRVTPEHALARDLAARRDAGQPIPLPLDVPPTHPWIAHYLFGHAFVLRPAPPEPGDPGPPRQRFVLVRELAQSSP